MAITACSHNINQMGNIADIDLDGELTHNPCRSSDFINTFAFHTQTHHQRANLGVGGFTLHNATHDIFHLRLGQMNVFGNMIQCLLNVHLCINLKKILKNLVSMLAQDGLWMKLNPLNRKCFMLYTHNFFNRAIWLIGPAGNF